MSTKIKTILALSLALLASVFIFSACNSEQHVHQYGEWTVTRGATCAASGEEARYCSCGDTQTRALPIKDHSYGEWVVVKVATCTEDGSQESSCVCGNKLTQSIPATGHSYDEWTATKAATCTAEGEEARSCSCGDTQTRALSMIAHSYGEWNIVKAVDCITNGSRERSCACGDIQMQNIPATGHKYGGWVVTEEATCKKSGERHSICLVCNDKRTEKISAAHDWLGATCTAPKTCSKCKATEGAKLGHTCKVGTCTRCKKYIAVEIKLPATPCTYNDYRYSDTVSASIKITNIRYEMIDDNDIRIYLTGEKTYDKKGSSYSTVLSIGYKLYDSSGYLVDSGFFYTDSLSVGEKFKDECVTIHDLEIDETYTLKLFDHTI